MDAMTTTRPTKTLHCKGTEAVPAHPYGVPADLARRAARCADCTRLHHIEAAARWGKDNTERVKGRTWVRWEKRQAKAAALAD